MLVLHWYPIKSWHPIIKLIVSFINDCDYYYSYYYDCVCVCCVRVCIPLHPIFFTSSSIHIHVYTRSTYIYIFLSLSLFNYIRIFNNTISHIYPIIPSFVIPQLASNGTSIPCITCAAEARCQSPSLTPETLHVVVAIPKVSYEVLAQLAMSSDEMVSIGWDCLREKPWNIWGYIT